MKKLYPGIGIIGNEKLSGIYGLNEGIVDAKGTGIQHLFYDSFETDLVHSASTLIKIKDTIYYGNRREQKKSHPVHLKPRESNIRNSFHFEDVFVEKNFRKIDKACAYGDNKIVFEMIFENLDDKSIEIEVYTYLILRNNKKLKAKKHGNNIIINVENKVIGIKAENSERIFLVQESPTGFIYRTTGAVLYDEDHSEDIETNQMLGVLVGGKIKIESKEKNSFKWGMLFNKDEKELPIQLKDFDIVNYEREAMSYWNNYLSEGLVCPDEEIREIANINQMTIKSAMINGFVPADLTGHYFSDGLPSYYARDSMMVARAFLLSGHVREFIQVVKYLMGRKRKKSGEFYQRYNGRGKPSEGANNEVFHQLDSIGYFMKNIYDYYKLSGEKLISQEEMLNLMRTLINSEKKNGMVGPEGGVNEGVFGPAYITSSNMFIYGGIKSCIEMLDDSKAINELKEFKENIFRGIEGTFIEDEGYMYGYVNYHDDLVKKYDTPQYFGVLYGFENTEKMKITHKNLLNNAAFYGDGIGYSEQEYHHGPWLFNTAACAEYAYINGEYREYNKKIKWLVNHCNQYGLMPEAVSADDENKSYINPLIWACAEFVSASFIAFRKE